MKVRKAFGKWRKYWVTAFSPFSAFSESFQYSSPSRLLKHRIRLLALNHSHTMMPFDAPGNKPFENTVGKGEIAHNEQFLLFPQCFLPIWITFCHFCQI